MFAQYFAPGCAMHLVYDDDAPLVPVLEELSTAGWLPFRITRSFVYLIRRGTPVPSTVGELRRALREPRTPQLIHIPQLGPVGITILRALFLGDDYPNVQRHRQVGGGN